MRSSIWLRRSSSARGAERVEFQDVIGGTLVARGVKDRAGEVDVQKEQLAGVIHAEIEAGVTFPFKADEHFGGSAPEVFIERRIRHVQQLLSGLLRCLRAPTT